jgi:hemerythrin-like domain-containing protein
MCSATGKVMQMPRPRTDLLQDHEEIELLLHDLLSAFDSGDRSVATEAFESFERRISAHLAFEDETLLPALAEIDRREADELAAEHRAIRARIDELAIADNLHLSRATQVHRLIDMLRTHAAREERTLYQLADSLADQPAVRSRLDRLRGGDRASSAQARE